MNDKRKKISDVNVLEMRRLYFVVGGWTQARLSREFQVSKNTVAAILAGTMRQNISMPKSEDEISVEAQESARRVFAALEAQKEQKSPFVTKEIEQRAEMYTGKKVVDEMVQYVPPVIESPEVIAERKRLSDRKMIQHLSDLSGMPLEDIQSGWNASMDKSEFINRIKRAVAQAQEVK